MSYHILESMINTIYFCRDGKLRGHLNSSVKTPKQEIAALIDIQDKLITNEIDKSLFFYTLINREIIFEKDITFGEFVDCLKPWEKQISMLLAKNTKSFFDSVTDDETFDPNKHYVQIMNSSILSKNFKRKKVEKEGENFDILKFINREKEDWDGSYVSHDEKNSFSVVNYEDNSKILWRSIYYGFNGLKNLKLKYISDLFFFINREDGISGGFLDKDLLIKSDGDKINSYNIIRIKNDYGNPTLNDILNGLFYASSDIYAPISSVEMSMIDPKELNQEKLETTKNIYIKESLLIKKITDNAKFGVSSINFTKIEKFSFNYTTITEGTFTVYNSRFKL